jgi:tetratricopeptide (TPR) repeat protein
MGFRFWRRIRIAKGVTLNLSKGGISTSFGPRGAKYTIGRRGHRATVGLPGTGLFYTMTPKSGSKAKNGAGRSRGQGKDSLPSPDRLTPGFFKRLWISDDELQFMEGLKAFTAGHHHKAFGILKQCLHTADAAFICGFLAINEKDFVTGEEALTIALAKQNELGNCLKKYNLHLTLGLNITDDIFAHVTIDRRGVLLGLVEIWQHQGQYQQAADALQELRAQLPQDMIVMLSLAELLLTTEPNNKDHAKYIVKMTARLANENEVHAALLLYKGRALRLLGMHTAARDALTTGLRRKKDRPEALLNALTYERALVYKDLGQKANARRALEKLYAVAPGYEDVAILLQA